MVFLHDYNINDEFIQLLAKQKKETVLTIFDKFYRVVKPRIYDPLSRLRLEILKLEAFRLERDNDRETTYCVMRKDVITLLNVYIAPNLETSNRIIRQ